jgi:hypothetical protein
VPDAPTNKPNPPGIIRMMCPNLNCRTVLGVPEAARGKMVRCRACGTSIRVPMAKTDTPPPTAGESTAA